MIVKVWCTKYKTAPNPTGTRPMRKMFKRITALVSIANVRIYFKSKCDRAHELKGKI